MTQMLLSFIPLAVIIILMIIFKIKINNKINYSISMLFLGILSLIITIIIDTTLTFLFPFIEEMKSMGSILYYLLFAGCAEEISKLLCLLASKPISNKKLIVNGILIATVFSIYEHYAYMSDILASNNIIMRLITPGHALYLLIPIWFIILGRKTNKKALCSIIGVILGIAVHTFYDYLQIDMGLAYVWCAIGYTTIIFSLYKASKMEDNEESKIGILSILLNIVKVIVIIGFTYFMFSIFNRDRNVYGLNRECNSEETHFRIMVTSVDEVTLDYNGSNDKYIKVGLRIQNDNEKTQDNNPYNFKLVDKVTNESMSRAVLIGDYNEIDLTYFYGYDIHDGYLYFKTDKKASDYYLQYKQLLDSEGSCSFKLSE